MITALTFNEVFSSYEDFKTFTDSINLYPSTDTIAEAFNQAIFQHILDRYDETELSYYDADSFKYEFRIAYQQYFRQFLAKKKIVDATNGITLEDYQIISESLSNFANNPNTLTTDPWELLVYTSQQTRGRAKAGKLTAYINALRQMPDAQIDAFLDRIAYMWVFLQDSCDYGQPIPDFSEGTDVIINGVKQDKVYFDSDPQEQITKNAEDITALEETKQDNINLVNMLSADLVDDNDTVHKFVTATEKSQIQTNANDIIILKANKYGASIVATIDSSTYIVTIQLKDQDGNNLGSAQTIDLPLESVVVGGSFDSLSNSVILTLNNGNTITIPVGDLISGLQSEITADNKLSADLVDDSTTTNKFVTATEKSQIQTNANNISDLQNNKADKNGDNLNSSDATNFRTTLGAPKFVTLYDYRSSDSNINWGKTSGIDKNVTVSNKDFSSYRYLICTLANSGGSFSVTIILDLRTNPWNNDDFRSSMIAYSSSNEYRVSVNHAKTSITNSSSYASAPILEIVGVII